MQHNRFFVGLIVISLALLTTLPGTAQQDDTAQLFLPYVGGSVQASPSEESAPLSPAAVQATPGSGADLQSHPYVIFDLGTLGGTYSFPSAINNHGQVIGTTGDVNYEQYAFLWQAGKMLRLGSLGGGYTNPTDINDQGQVVGTSYTPDGNYHAFLWENGNMIDLGTLGYPVSNAIAMNEQGQVIGLGWDNDSGESRGFLWQNGTMISLGVLNPIDINEQGQIIGTAIGVGGVQRPFLWENGVAQYLGTLGGESASLTTMDLNDLGQVVGTSYTPDGNRHAFLWENGVMHDLGTLGGPESGALHINNRGQIVGWSRLNLDDSRIFLWENGVMRELGAHFGSDIHMNEQGQVVGQGYDSSHIFLWTNGVVTDLGEPALSNPQSGYSYPIALNDHGQALIYGTSEMVTRAYLATNIPPFPERLLLLSSSTGGTVGGVSFADEDILAQNLETHVWTMYFDGSDVGVTDDVDAFGVLPDGSLLLSLGNQVQVPSLGTVDDSDIIRFHPTSLGSRTLGSFTWYFDGSDMNLTTGSEDIDAIHVTPDGLLILSTLGHVEVKGVIGADEDLLTFHSTHLGAETAGSWTVYFDGSDVRLTDTSEDVWGLWRDFQTHDLYLTTAGTFHVSGLWGRGADISIFHPVTLGRNTTGTFEAFWRGADYGFGGEIIDDIEIVTRLPLLNEVVSAESESFEPEIGDDIGDDVPDDFNEETSEESNYQVFLPLLQR